jgi:hypothetical protein
MSERRAVLETHFRNCVVWATLLFFPTVLRAGNKADQEKPYGAISILESSEQEVETLGNTGQTGTKKVVAYVTANQPCEVLIAAFNRDDRRLAHGWKPQWVSLEEWHEQQLTLGSYVNPADPQKRTAIEVWALFLASPIADAKKAAVAGKIQTLNAAFKGVIQNRGEDAGKRENTLLRHLEDFIEDDPQTRRPKLEPLAKAGEFRDPLAPPPWRNGAAEVNFNTEKPGLVIIPSEPPETFRPGSR